VETYRLQHIYKQSGGSSISWDFPHQALSLLDSTAVTSLAYGFLILSVVTHLEATHKCVYFFLFLDDYNDMKTLFNKGTKNKYPA